MSLRRQYCKCWLFKDSREIIFRYSSVRTGTRLLLLAVTVVSSMLSTILIGINAPESSRTLLPFVRSNYIVGNFSSRSQFLRERSVVRWDDQAWNKNCNNGLVFNFEGILEYCICMIFLLRSIRGVSSWRYTYIHTILHAGNSYYANARLLFQREGIQEKQASCFHSLIK